MAGNKHMVRHGLHRPGLIVDRPPALFPCTAFFTGASCDRPGITSDIWLTSPESRRCGLPFRRLKIRNLFSSTEGAIWVLLYQNEYVLFRDFYVLIDEKGGHFGLLLT
jgi:hypothetical protein